MVHYMRIIVVVVVSFLSVATQAASGSGAFFHRNLPRRLEQQQQQQQRRLQLPNTTLAGIWTPRGYGYVMNVTEGGVIASVTEETSISCILNNELVNGIEDFQVVNDDLATIDVGTNVPYLYDRGDDYVSGCRDGFLTPLVGDANYVRNALQIYDILVQTFREHYAFFELRGIDWESLTASTRMNLTSDSSDDDLFQAFVALLEPLQDAHAFIESDTDGFASADLPVFAQFEQEAEEQGQDPDEYINDQVGNWIAGIVASYMEGQVLNGIPFNGPVWGIFNGTRVGYIQMFGLGAEDDDEFALLLNEIFTQLKNETDTIVVDQRINEGGGDTTATLLASYFAPERTLAYTQKAVFVNDDDSTFTEPQPVYLDPVDEAYRFDGNVVVIISDSCVSACETYAISMAQLPQTTFVGRNTLGAFSDVLEKLLPNGWVFGLSNEVVQDPEGTIFEMVGIPADVTPNVGLLPLEERQEGTDSWLELALATALQMPSPTAMPTTQAPTMSPTDPPAMAAPTGSTSTTSGSMSGLGRSICFTLAIAVATTVVSNLFGGKEWLW